MPDEPSPALHDGAVPYGRRPPGDPFELPVLDAVTFAALRSLQADTVLLAAFLQDTGPRLATVRAAFAAGRPADARDALHNLRSTAGQLGAAQMAAVVEHLYQAVRTNQPCDPRWLADLDRTWLILQPMLVAMQRLS